LPSLFVFASLSDNILFFALQAVAAGVKEQDTIHHLEKLFKKTPEIAKTLDLEATISLAITTLQNVKIDFEKYWDNFTVFCHETNNLLNK